MQLYLMRHGIAVDVGEDGVRTDAERMLSAEGRRKTRRAAEGLAALGCRPDRVAASPLARAMETAEIACEALGANAPPAVCRPLRPGGSFDDFARWLARQDADTVLAVGHMPDLAWFASRFLAGHPRIEIAYRKAAVCRLVFEGAPAAATGRLDGLLQPRELRRLAGKG